MFLLIKKKITSIAEPVPEVGGSNFPESKNMEKILQHIDGEEGVQTTQLESASDFTVA